MAIADMKVIEDGDILLSTSITHVAEVNFKRMTALALSPNDFSELAGGDIQDWLDDHPEATTTVQDGSISMVKLTDETRNNVEAGMTVASGEMMVTGWASGYVNVDTNITSVNLSSLPVQSHATLKYVLVGCQQYDIFEIYLHGGEKTRPFAILDEDGNIIQRTTKVSATNGIPYRTYLVVSQADAAYVLFQNYIANGYVKKVTMQEYVEMRTSVSWTWLRQHIFGGGQDLLDTGGTETRNAYTVFPFIPVRYGDKIECCFSNQNNRPIMQFYSKDFQSLYTLRNGASSVERDDYGASQVYVTPIHFSFIAPEDGWIRCASYYNYEYYTLETPPEWFTNLTRQFHLSIEEYNAHSRMNLIDSEDGPINRMLVSRIYSKDNDTKPLTILHMSDLHGDSTNWKNAIFLLAQKERFGNYVDAAICTGDIIYSDYSDSTTFLDAYYNSYADIMRVIGNHDIRVEGNPFKYLTSGDAIIPNVYSRYMENYIDNWGVTTDPNTDYPTYYYKDFLQQQFRLIVLDLNMDQTITTTEYNNQMNWFTSVLNDARLNNLAVIVAEHFPVQGTPVKIECNFTDPGDINWTHIGDSSYNESTILDMQDRVNRFIHPLPTDQQPSIGGEFVCYLAGHNHGDFIYHTTEYPDQLCILVSTNSVRVRAGLHHAMSQDSKNRNLFNTVTFVRSRKQIRLVRFGLDLTSIMNSKKTLCLNYQTQEVLGWS